MTRLRTGHVNLNETHIIGTHQAGLCEHCQVAEMVHHRQYTSKRKDMMEGTELGSSYVKGLCDLITK